MFLISENLSIKRIKNIKMMYLFDLLIIYSYYSYKFKNI